MVRWRGATPVWRTGQPARAGFDSYTIRETGTERSRCEGFRPTGKVTWRGATPVLNTGQISRRGIGFESYTFRDRDRGELRDRLEGEVTRVVAPASNTGEGPRGSGFESPVFRESSASSREIRHRDVAQERSACSGNTRPQVRFLSSRRRNGSHFGLSETRTVFCSCRRCEERDTILRRSMVEVRILPAVLVWAGEARFPIIQSTRRIPKGTRHSELHSLSACCFTGRWCLVTDFVHRVARREARRTRAPLFARFYVEVW